MMLAMSKISALIVSMVALAVHAQPRSVDLNLTFSDNNQISSRFAYELREQLAKSGTLKAADRADAALIARMILLDTGVNGRTNQVLAYSLVLTARAKAYEHYLTSQVAVCGETKLESCARDVMATLSSVEIWVPTDYFLPDTKKK